MFYLRPLDAHCSYRTIIFHHDPDTVGNQEAFLVIFIFHRYIRITPDLIFTFQHSVQIPLR